MDFVIESGHPIPAKRGGRKVKYPFGQMAIGDSFSFEDSCRHKVSNAAARYGNRYGKKFSIRKTNEGFRVWRVS